MHHRRSFLRWSLVAGGTLPCLKIGDSDTLWAADNQLLPQLLSTDAKRPAAQAIQLPEPLLNDEMNGTQQRQALENVAEGKHTWQALTRKAVVAPFVLKTEMEAAGADASVRKINLWFVAYGDLATIKKDSFLTEQFQSTSTDDDEATARVLTKEELEKRKIPAERLTDSFRFVAADVTLMQRVRVEVTTCTELTETAQSVVAATQVAEEFASDPERPNQWTPLVRDASGKLTKGTPQPYSEMASYVKATQLKDIGGALLVEYHLAFIEPRGWFNGSNLLRSKIPIVAQNIVRQVRRGLTKKN